MRRLREISTAGKRVSEMFRTQGHG